MIKTVHEYDRIYKEDFNSSFDELKSFLCSEKTGAKYDDLVKYSTSGGKEYLQVKNYAGVIAFRNGDMLEILPKKISSEENDDAYKRLLMRMLETVHNVHSEVRQFTSIGIEKLPLLEVFIHMFIGELDLLVKKGLRGSYIEIEENSTAFKGKMLFNKQIQYNSVNKQRCYCITDEFSLNRPENRLIKSTLCSLCKISKYYRNQNELHRLITVFEEIEASTDIKGDFSKCLKDRNLVHYELVLSWCEVFLNGMSFTSYSGRESAYAILFPMEKLFEAYIAAEMKKTIAHTDEFKGLRLTTQETLYNLYGDQNKGNLRPDIVVRGNNCSYIFDTKWKNENKNGVSQGDLYQMFAYQKKYLQSGSRCKCTVLLYPDAREEQFTDKSDGLRLDVKKIDLMNDAKGNVREQLKKIIEWAGK